VSKLARELSPRNVREPLEQLTASLNGHPALYNNFYRLWMSKPLSIRGLEVFVRNYGAFVKSFPNAMAAIIQMTDDLEAKTEHVNTLFSEMGYGKKEKLHSVLFDNFFAELAKKLGHEGRLDRSRLEREYEVLPTTRRFIDGEMMLYGGRNPRIAVGAQLAQEWQAYTMLRQLYDGARNYMYLWENPDEFHENCEYYYVHIGAAEKDHKEESISAALKYMVDEASLAEITEGFDIHLQIYTDFWEGMYEAIVALGD
jgi:pyrroloquinoline quinone (PQQ) biosynthesis protein C